MQEYDFICMKFPNLIKVGVAANCRSVTEILPSMSLKHSRQFMGNCVVAGKLRASKLRNSINKKCV